MPMKIYSIISLVLAFAAFIGFINHRLIKIAPAIAIMVGMLLVSLLLLLGESFGFYHIPQQIAQIPNALDFHELLMNCLISFLLFAGGLTVDAHFLYRQRWEILILAMCSTIISAFLIAYGTYHILILLGINISLLYCLLFGALISPTDPIAVLALCKEVGAPKQLEVILAGESLFNDGVGIILFSALYSLLIQSGEMSWHNILVMFMRSALGGISYGLILGALTRYLILSVSDHRIAILITLALTTAGYTFAQHLNISGPLAIVVAGIYIGTIRQSTKQNLHIMEEVENFWDVIDEVLNALLFALLGLEVLITHFNKKILFASIAAIIIVLIARYLTVAIPFTILKYWRKYSSHIVLILTWGGMRGALAIALALILPMGDARNIILCMTYAVVVFAIIVQGGSIKSLVSKSKAAEGIKN
jgi:CPA1 family monovalent cation:H+ antiporter